MPVEALLDDVCLTLVQDGQPRQRLVQCKQFLTARLCDCPHVPLEVKRSAPTTALLAAARDGVIDQDAAHRLRGNRQVMRSIAPLNPIQLAQLDPGLVDESRGAQRMAVALVAQLAGSDSTELVIPERNPIFHSPNRSRFTA